MVGTVDVQATVKSTRPVVELGPPISEDPVENLDIEKQRSLKAGIPKTKTGGAVQTQTGIWYVNLDPEGNPVGPISATPPEDPLQPFITVTNSDKVDPDELTTSSGAPLTNQMNPEHSFYDAGMAARNPRPPPALDVRTGAIRRSPVTADAGYGQKAVDSKTAESEAERKRKEDQRTKDAEAATKAAKRA